MNALRPCGADLSLPAGGRPGDGQSVVELSRQLECRTLLGDCRKLLIPRADTPCPDTPAVRCPGLALAIALSH